MFAKLFGVKTEDITKVPDTTSTTAQQLHPTIQDAERRVSETAQRAVDIKDEAKLGAHVAWDVLKAGTYIAEAAHKLVDTTQNTLHYTADKLNELKSGTLEKLGEAKQSLSGTAKNVADGVTHEWNVVKDATTETVEKAGEKLHDVGELVQGKTQELSDSKKWNLVNASAQDAAEILMTGSSHRVDDLKSEPNLTFTESLTSQITRLAPHMPPTIATHSIHLETPMSKYGDLNIHGAADHTPEIRAAIDHIKHASDDLKGLLAHKDN